MTPRYTRILLKLSGEVLAGSQGFGLDNSTIQSIVADIKEVLLLGVQTGVVIGGGNFLRGTEVDERFITRTTADTMGMLATVMNSLALKSHLETMGVKTTVLCATPMEKVGEFFTVERAEVAFASKAVVIIAGGTGNPFFTTDTAAALRCAELGAQVLLKATKVDGIYDSDPKKNPAAKKIPQLTHAEAISRNLRIMDAAAFALCQENNIPIIVFKLLEKGNLCKCCTGENIGSLVHTGG